MCDRINLKRGLHMEEESATRTKEEEGREFAEVVSNQVSTHFTRFNVRAAFAGVFLALATILLAKLITLRVSGAGLSGFISETSAAVFIGASTGHFFGMALRKEGDRMTSFLLGGSVTLAAALLGIVGVSITGGVLITFAVGVFLMHNSGLVANHEQIEEYVELFSERVSAMVLGILAIWQYIRPLVMGFLGGFSL